MEDISSNIQEEVRDAMEEEFEESMDDMDDIEDNDLYTFLMNEKEESAQYREGEVTGSRRSEVQLSRNQSTTQAVKAARQNGTPEGPRGDDDGRKDIDHEIGERNKVKRGSSAQGGSAQPRIKSTGKERK